MTSTTLPESTDLNPLENVWHELKEHLKKEVKPWTNDELVMGITDLWKTVTPAKCSRYIRHLQKAILQDIKEEGAAMIILLRFTHSMFIVCVYFFFCIAQCSLQLHCSMQLGRCTLENWLKNNNNYPCFNTSRSIPLYHIHPFYNTEFSNILWVRGSSNAKQFFQLLDWPANEMYLD